MRITFYLDHRSLHNKAISDLSSKLLTHENVALSTMYLTGGLGLATLIRDMKDFVLVILTSSQSGSVADAALSILP